MTGHKLPAMREARKKMVWELIRRETTEIDPHTGRTVLRKIPVNYIERISNLPARQFQAALDDLAAGKKIRIEPDKLNPQILYIFPPTVEDILCG